MTQEQTVINAESTEDAAVLAEQRRIIDAAVRQARANSWCEEFERIMGGLFPDGPPDGDKEFVDSDGQSCRGRDRMGFDRYGFDREGRNREGFDQNGYDRDGFNRDGVDQYGWSRDGWNADHTINRDSDEYRARFRYDPRGYDADGFTAQGVHRNTGLNREQHAAYVERERRMTYVYDADGYDVNGRDRYGDRRY